MPDATLESILRLTEQLRDETRATRRIFDQQTRLFDRIDQGVMALHHDVAHQSSRMDAISDRLSRIERRVGLIDAR